MYIHIGNNKSIPMQSVIAIIRADDEHMKKNALFFYLENKDVEYLKSDEVVKTYIITNEVVYASPVSIQTLTKRVNEFNNIVSSFKKEKSLSIL